MTADIPFQAQGQKKVASMMESKEVHKGIYQIEWEHKKMEMEMEDLNQKAWDIQMLFFSRDRQKARLPSPGPRVHLIHSFINSHLVGSPLTASIFQARYVPNRSVNTRVLLLTEV